MKFRRKRLTRSRFDEWEDLNREMDRILMLAPSKHVLRTCGICTAEFVPTSDADILCDLCIIAHRGVSDETFERYRLDIIKKLVAL